jgi:hypothetical protein
MAALSASSNWQKTERCSLNFPAIVLPVPWQRAPCCALNRLPPWKIKDAMHRCWLLNSLFAFQRSGRRLAVASVGLCSWGCRAGGKRGEEPRVTYWMRPVLSRASGSLILAGGSGQAYQLPEMGHFSTLRQFPHPPREEQHPWLRLCRGIPSVVMRSNDL